MSSCKGRLSSDLMLVEQRKLLSDIYDSVVLQQTLTTWLTSQLNTPHK